jgi:hypothetical protein
MDPNQGETARLVRLGQLRDDELETIKQKVEREMKEALAEANARGLFPNPVPPTKVTWCHWCQDGIMAVTPTKGRLECSACGAVSICGRQESITHVRAGR